MGTPSTPWARQRAAGRAWAALLFFLAAVLSFTATAGNASAAPVSTTETRVGVSAPGTITAVGLPVDIAAGQHPVRAGPQQDLAQGHGVHTFYVMAGETPVLVHNNVCRVEPPDQPAAFSDLRRVKSKTPIRYGGGLRRRWKDAKGRIYEWDYQHGTIEKYSKRGEHLGEFDPNTGLQLKPADSSRSVTP